MGKISGSRVIFLGTGKYLEISDVSNTQQQTEYAIKDDDAGTFSTFVNSRTTLVQQTLSNNTAVTATKRASINAVDTYTSRGLYVDFTESGERINIDCSLV